MYDPVENPRKAKQRRDLVLERMREQRMITEGEYRDARAQALPGGRGGPSPAGRLARAVLHQLADTAAGRSLSRAGACSAADSRSKSTLDPDLQAAAVKAIDRAAVRHWAERIPGGDREQDGRGEGHGRWSRLREEAFQPGHERAPAARLGVQALHPGSRAAGRRQPGGHVHVTAQGAARQGRCPVCRPELRGSVLGHLVAALRHGAVGQLGVCRTRAEGGDAPDRASWRTRWACARRSRPTRR